MKIRQPIVAEKFFKVWSKINGFEVIGFSFFFWTFINRPDPKNNTMDGRSWKKTANHESIHYYQQKELLWLFFYPIYVGHYLVNLLILGYAASLSCLGVGALIIYFSGFQWPVLLMLVPLLWYLVKNFHYDAYMGIVFEKEAYAHQWKFDYLETRKRFAWIHFL